MRGVELPGATKSCRALVGRLTALAVTALAIAMSMLASWALSIRSKATSRPPLSTTAITICQPFFVASASGGGDRFLARSRLMPGP